MVAAVPRPRVDRAAADVRSSARLAPKVEMVVLAGNTNVFKLTLTSESIKAPASVTLAVSVTSASASMSPSLVN